MIRDTFSEEMMDLRLRTVPHRRRSSACVLAAPQEAAPILYGTHPETRSIAMPSVLDAPEYLEHVEIQDLHIEKSRARRARPGFWRTLAHGIPKHLTRTPRAKQAPSCRVRGRFAP